MFVSTQPNRKSRRWTLAEFAVFDRAVECLCDGNVREWLNRHLTPGVYPFAPRSFPRGRQLGLGLSILAKGR